MTMTITEMRYPIKDVLFLFRFLVCTRVWMAVGLILTTLSCLTREDPWA